MSQSVIDKLKYIIANQLDVNIKLEEIDDNDSLFEDGIGLDSVVIVEFITLIEETFGFQFSEDHLNMDLFQNLRTLADAISTKLKN